jgi:hypothetical protein
MPDFHSEKTCSHALQISASYNPKHIVIPIRSFIAVITNAVNKINYINTVFSDYKGWKFCNSETTDGRLELGFKTDSITLSGNKLTNDRFVRLILGDDSEISDTSENRCVASCAFLNIDLSGGSIEAFSSIVGLPPLFVYKSDGVVVLTSALHLLSGVPQIKRELDIEAIYETFQIGYPIQGRTLLKNVQMLPAGNVLKANTDGQCSMAAGWNYPEFEPMTDWDAFIDLQVEAFRNAVNHLDVENSFLSMTGGLDTRTVFAALLERGVRIQASTLSGKNLSLDARIAKSLCERYHSQHFIVNLNQDFLRNLPEYTTEASRLSGGLTSLEQAHEVYFYRQLQHVGSRRISGNLGNQVGRGGVEGTSIRNADVSILNTECPEDCLPEMNQHWLETLSCRSNAPLFKLLLQHEVPYTFVSNYSIGQHFAVQQSPYANLQLIEATCRRPVDSIQTNIFRTSHARLKDLRHRFFGEDPAISFQQKVILSQGGYVAECPINWGWRVKGGVSLSGLGMGLLAFCDAYAGRSNPISSIMAKGLYLIKADGMHIFKQHKIWLINHMSDFVYDSLNSKKVIESGLLNKNKIDKLLTEYYSEKNTKSKDLIAALDIALALQHFS